MGHNRASARIGGSGGVFGAAGGTGDAAAELHPGVLRSTKGRSTERGARTGTSVMRRACLLLIRAYQTFLGPFLGGSCRFYPSCSHYAAEAIERHGARRGSRLAIRRLLRCHPFTPGGIDLVPEEIEPAEDVAGEERPTASPEVPGALTVATQAGHEPMQHPRREFAR